VISPADQVLYLQRTIGNQAVQRLVRSGVLQAKLRIGQPGDMYEQEADRVAEAVMRMPELGVQRQVEPQEEEKETLQTKPLVNQITPLVQRQVEPEEEEEEEELQAKATSGHISEANPNLESNIQSLKGGGQPLSENNRAFFEPRFGRDFSQVRVHAGTQAAEAARAVNARAFTAGRDVVFGEGEYKPETNAGRRLLAHELTHVMQQRGNQGSTDKSNIQRKDTSSILPKAIVSSASAEVFQNPNTSSSKLYTLKQNDPIDRILKKKKVGTVWWYNIQYSVGSTTKAGWSQATNFTEIAQPKTFKFETPGSTGFASPFEELREAVKKGKLNPKIARLINMMNLILRQKRLELTDFTSQSFYTALVSAKGNFKQASLLVTAAVRAFKPVKTGKYPWVQQRNSGSARFKLSNYRDKLWHFFWNAYKRFDGTSASRLKHLGLIYELKSRSNPLKSFFTLKPLSRDANEDILFNHGGIQFAEWIMKNERSILNHHTVTIRDNLESELKKMTEYKKMTDVDKKQLIQMAMMEKAVQTEIKKLTYFDYSKAVAFYVKAVLDAIKKLKP